jgi:hypothetical protein
MSASSPVRATRVRARSRWQVRVVGARRGEPSGCEWLGSWGVVPRAEDADPSCQAGRFEGREDGGVELVGPVGHVAGCGEAGGRAEGAQRDGVGSTVVGGEQFGNGGDAAAASSTLQVDNRADATADEPSDDVERGTRSGQGHRLQTGRHLLGAAGVQGGQETAVASIGGLEHVQDLGAANFADHDTVGTHAKGVANQLA